VLEASENIGSLEASAAKESEARAWHARFAAESIWSLIASLISYGGNFLIVAVAARHLGTERFGHLGMITGTVAAFGVFAGMGLATTAARYVARFRDHDAERTGEAIALTLWMTVVLGIGVGTILWFLAPQLATGKLNAPFLLSGLRLGVTLLALSALQTTQNGILSGLEALRDSARSSVLRVVVGLPLTWVAVRWYGVQGAIFASVVALAVCCAVNEISIRRLCASRGIRRRFAEAGRFRGELLRYAVPAFIAGAVAVPTQWYAMTLLSGMPNGYVQVGLLNAVNNWKALITFLPVTLGTAALPMLAAMEHRPDDSDGVELAHAVTQLALWPVALCCLVLAGPIMGTYGDGFREGRTLFVLMIAGTAVGFVGNALGTLVMSAGMVWLGVVQNVVFSVIFLCATLVLRERYGVLALAVGTFAAYAFLMTWTAVYLRRRRRISGDLMNRALAGGALMALAAVAGWYSPHAPVWATIPLALICGGGVAWLLSCPDARRRLWSLARAPRLRSTLRTRDV
jgi:O-antigen/teichoic acid export membrane protein